MAYVAPIAVLKEAGLYHRELAELASGPVDGVNKVFTVIHKPLVPAKGTESTVAASDVTAYVNGVPVAVSGVVSASGAVTLSVPPAIGSVVTLDYSYSPIAIEDAVAATEEADAALNQAVRDVGTIAEGDVDARKISRFYAAGLLMAREYGLQSVTEETTKEGQRKIKQAEAWLTDYRARLVADDTADKIVPRSSDDKRLFQQYDSSTGSWRPLNDTSFKVNGR